MTDRSIRCSDALTVTFSPAGKDQLQIVASQAQAGGPGATVAAEAYTAIAKVLSAEGLQVVHERVFGSIGAMPAILQARRGPMARIGQEGGAVTCVQGRPLWGEGFAGLQMHAVRLGPSDEAWTIHDADRPVGKGWKRLGLKFLVVQNMHGLDDATGADNTPSSQARRMFEQTRQILARQGAGYKDVARTWIYLSDILGWYGSFNAARNERYAEYGLMGPPVQGGRRILLPASTGIEGDNPMGAACVMDVLVVVTDHASNGKVVQLSNLRQQDAFQYGSAFSRGACIVDGDVTHIHISGTAAIDEQGRSMFGGDVRRQIHRTLDNVEALVAQRGAGLKDMCNSTVFFKDPKDAAAWRQIAAERGLTEMPAVCVVADICRDELLFEIDGVVAVPS